MRRAILVLALAACSKPIGYADSGPDDSPDAEPAPVAEIHRIGRFDDQDRFSWPGTSIRARFTGTGISVRLADTGTNHFDVVIDGEAADVLEVSGASTLYPLAAGLADGEHEVVITRRTESFFGITTFEGFEGATLVPSAGRGRMIEMIGDSITCGYGVLGDSATCQFTAATEAETAAWGGLAARELDADHVAIAYSGLGVYRNYGDDTSPTLPQRYGRVFAEDAAVAYDFADYTPDAVVINLGTNDFSTGDPGQPFVDAYVDFVAEVRGRYPSAWIVVAMSPMLSDSFPGGAMHRTRARAHLEAVVAASGARVSYLEIAEQSPDDGYGCDYHPNTVTAGKMKDALVAELREALDW